MPVRTLNYTGRKRIGREDARITIREEKSGNIFDAGLSLTDYGLPGDARIFVDAYRLNQYMRFDFGKVGAMLIPDDRLLRAFDSTEGVLFRVKVVTSADPHGLLLAQADQIRPRKSTDEDENRISLLPVRPSWDLEDEIWVLEFDTQDTRILINATLGDWRTIAREPFFIALVYPHALRSILMRILKDEEEWRDTEDMDDWRSRWLHFAVSLPGVSDPPGENEGACLDDWIDSVASAFCRRHNIRANYERYRTGGQE